MELTALLFIFIGFAFGLALTSIVWLGWQEDAEAETRYWRKEALDARARLSVYREDDRK